MIERGHKKISIKRQCELLGLNRSNYYYKRRRESIENLLYMRLIDEQYLSAPFYGVRKMTEHLRSLNYRVNHKRIRRLMRTMGLEAIYRKPNLSRANKAHKIYPYLLKGLKIERVNQVWSSDITYIPMQSGHFYLVVIIDIYSRFVLSWELSNSLEESFCQRALHKALARGTPEIFNTDQGIQFTSIDYTEILKKHKVQISMDGKGRALDNIYIERLWRSLKYEDIYLKSYEDGKALYRGLQAYFAFYNHERLHQSLNYRKPADIFFQQLRKKRDNNLLTRQKYKRRY